ncbi:MAG: hypothetical protein ACTS4Y_00995 [Candidatus Hodgkinia cicadicola]
MGNLFYEMQTSQRRLRLIIPEDSKFKHSLMLLFKIACKIW